MAALWALPQESLDQYLTLRKPSLTKTASDVHVGRASLPRAAQPPDPELAMPAKALLKQVRGLSHHNGIQALCSMCKSCRYFPRSAESSHASPLLILLCCKGPAAVKVPQWQDSAGVCLGHEDSIIMTHYASRLQ